jgi:hypothetical protein
MATWLYIFCYYLFIDRHRGLYWAHQTSRCHYSNYISRTGLPQRYYNGISPLFSDRVSIPANRSVLFHAVRSTRANGEDINRPKFRHLNQPEPKPYCLRLSLHMRYYVVQCSGHSDSGSTHVNEVVEIVGRVVLWRKCRTLGLVLIG